MHKSVAFSSLLILILSSFLLITTETVTAQKGVTTPVLTDFLISYETFPVHYPPTYTVDPSTGTGILDKPGYDTDTRRLILHIFNQLFEPYYDSEGHVVNAFFEVRWKVLGSDSWEYRPDYARYTAQPADYTSTAIILGFKGFNDPSMLPLLDFVSGEQLDFQIKSSIGYLDSDGTLVGKSTDWGETHTFTIPKADGSTATPNASTQPYQSNTPSPSSGQNTGVSSTPYVSGFGDLGWLLVVLVILLVVIAVLLVFVVFYLRKRAVKPAIT